MSSFTPKKLDNFARQYNNYYMRSNSIKSGLDQPTTADTVRRRIQSGGERVWRFVDFSGMPFPALAKTLSRLTRTGMIQRLGKGLYYRAKQTAFGPSKPNISKIRSLPVLRKGIYLSGMAAGNLLGFTTQNPAKAEISTDGSSLPRLIVGKETIIHTRRPEAWRNLSQTEAALLDFLRNRGDSSELSAKETKKKLLEHFMAPGLFGKLLKVAESEPPRVRALLGAIGQEIGQPKNKLVELKTSLNQLSRFDFGILNALSYAQEWQAKERNSDEII